jgi:hypothetical protein
MSATRAGRIFLICNFKSRTLYIEKELFRLIMIPVQSLWRETSFRQPKKLKSPCMFCDQCFFSFDFWNASELSKYKFCKCVKTGVICVGEKALLYAARTIVVMLMHDFVLMMRN